MTPEKRVVGFHSFSVNRRVLSSNPESPQPKARFPISGARSRARHSRYNPNSGRTSKVESVCGVTGTERTESAKTDASNLLDPTGRRHGLQAYDFAADDLAQGVQKSAFGEKRTVSLKNLGLVLEIAVSRAAVSPVSGSRYQIDALELQIEANNLNH